MARVTINEAKPIHEQFYQEFVTLLVKYKHLDKYEQLAIVANALGKLVAIQDPRRTVDSVMGTVAKNIEAGNEQMILELNKRRET